MNRPQSWSSREEALLLINAYLDNELDAASVLEVEARLKDDPSLKAEFDRLSALRSAIAAQAGKPRASDDFAQRIAAIAESRVVVPMARPAKTVPRYAWRQMAAAAAAAACVTGTSLTLFPRGPDEATQLAEIVSGHQRALLASAPFDIASSDRHTVKPWFDTKLALSPKVVDLADAGFPLIGGRVDIVEGQPAPVSVYKRREHLISLIAVPHVGNRDDGRVAIETTRTGYAVRTWPGRDFDYSAVSDVAEHELDDFVTRWRAGARAN